MTVDALHPFDLNDRALTLGDGVFDTCLSVDGAPVLGERHLRRLWKSCRAMGYGIERDWLAREYAPIRDRWVLSVLRITVTGGPGPRGLAPPVERRSNVFTSRHAWSAGRLFRPVHLSISPIRRNETAPTSRHKTVSYLDNVMAMAQSRLKGADDALLLNTTGAVTGTTVANLFLIDGETCMATPRLCDGVLDGVTRELVLELAEDMGISVDVRTIGLDDVEAAAGLFVTNSLGLLMPVTRVEWWRYRSEEDPLFRNMSNAVVDALGIGAYAKRHVRGQSGTAVELQDGERNEPVRVSRPRGDDNG